MSLDRRTVVAALAASLAGGGAARAAAITDAAGRVIPVPARVKRVLPAGPPAAIMIYTLAPELLIG